MGDLMMNGFTHVHRTTDTLWRMPMAITLAFAIALVLLALSPGESMDSSDRVLLSRRIHWSQFDLGQSASAGALDKKQKDSPVAFAINC
jgi:protein involved in temperature-dependent protein secretion